jgi:predicted transcriptional regulator of viral defense system
MKHSTLTKLRQLIKKPSFTAADAKAQGVSASLLAYYVKKKQLEKIAHGVYRGIDAERSETPFEWEDLISTAASIPNGRVCLISALALYELTDEIPRQFWIAIPHKQFPPKRPKTKIVRMRDANTGATRLKLGSATIRIFDRERTIVDAFRFLAPETAIKSLKRYLSGSNGKPNLAKLRRYSLKLKVQIGEYIEALTI